MAVFPTTPPISELQGLQRMAVAVCSGATIGYLRRERRGMMRTMAMVSLGSATFTLNALIGLPHSDPGRTTAAIISGVGFLGAGVITQPVTVMEGRRGNDFTDTRAEAVSGEQRTELQIRPVYGLTTAAAIWMSAAMGIACGAGRLQGASHSNDCRRGEEYNRARWGGYRGWRSRVRRLREHPRLL